MTARNGFHGDMDRFALDAGTAERVLAGAVEIDDAPPPYRSVVRVLDALRADPDEAELAGGPAAVDGIASAVVFEPRAPAARHPRRRCARARLLAAASVVCCVLLGGGLAAAEVLPAPAQRATSAVLSQVGISVPNGDEEATDHHAPSPAAHPVEPDPVAGKSRPPASAKDAPRAASAKDAPAAASALAPGGEAVNSSDPPNPETDPPPLTGLSIALESHDFGTTMNVPETFTVTNNGPNTSGTLTVILLGGDDDTFDISNDDCTGQTLVAGGTCTVQAAFDATGAATGRKTTLVARSDNPDDGEAVATLTGTVPE
jgi:hypothetical protein